MNCNGMLLSEAGTRYWDHDEMLCCNSAPSILVTDIDLDYHLVAVSISV
jgi:hypothetical protein